MVGLMNDRLFGGMAGCLAAGRIGCLFACLIDGFLFWRWDWLMCWSIECLLDCSVCPLTIGDASLLG